MATISLNEVIAHIDSGAAFDIEFVTCDRKRGTGGELKAFADCVKTNTPVPGPKGVTERLVTKTKNPHHQANSTVNIYIPKAKEREDRIVSVHLRLITQLNGKDVV